MINNTAVRKKHSRLKEFLNRKKRTIGPTKAIVALIRKIATILRHFVKKMKYTKMKQGIKREKYKRKIVETEIFSIDERIKIISGIIAIMGKEEEESA